MAYDVNIQRAELQLLIDLQGGRALIEKWCGEGLPEFPQKPNTYTSKSGDQLCWVAPERWLLRSSIDNEDRLLETTRPESAPLDISIVEVSDSYQFFRLTGPDAGEIVSIACPLDHHTSVFPANGISYTSLFNIKGLLARIDDGFEIAVEASFGDMIEDYLSRANA